MNDSTWEFKTFYSPNNNLIVSKIDFYSNGTTKFDETDLYLQCPGCFITYGTWSLNGNVLTYIWEGNNPNNSTYVYSGTLSGNTMNGTFTHPSMPGTFTAENLN